MHLTSIVKAEENISADTDYAHAEANESRQLVVLKEEPPDIPPLMAGRNRGEDFAESCSSYVGANSSEYAQKAQRKPAGPVVAVWRRPRNGIPGIVTESPDWLPAGWVTEMKTRESGLSAGTTDKYYIEPVTRHRFRSKAEVLRFLETGQIARARRKSRPAASVPPLNIIKPEDVMSKNSGAEPRPSEPSPPQREFCSCRKPFVYYQPMACYSPLYAAYPGMYPVVFLPVIENEGRFEFPQPEVLQNIHLQTICPWPSNADSTVNPQHFPCGPRVGSAWNQFHTSARPTNAHGHVDLCSSRCTTGSCATSGNPVASKAHSASDCESLRTATSVVGQQRRAGPVPQHGCATATSAKQRCGSGSVLLEQQKQVPRMRGQLASLSDISSLSSGSVP